MTYKQYIAALLLSVLACCTREILEPTALRVAVYSDIQLERVEVTILDAASRETMYKNSYDLSMLRRDQTNFLFRFYVERAPDSQLKDIANVRVDGYAPAALGGGLITRQAVRVRFVDEHTRLARVWLGKTCASDAQRSGDVAVCAVDGLSCFYATGLCESDEVPISTEEDSAQVDDQGHWVPDNYPVCGNDTDGVCPARHCATADDFDCRLKNGTACTSDALCASSFCAKTCATGDCDSVCADSRCSDPCAFSDRNGVCQHLDYSSDRSNCGGCGVSCAAAEAEASCRSSKCEIDSCRSTHSDCNHDVRDGCEVDLHQDADHCGSCDKPTASCHYRRCDAGTCAGKQTPVTTYKGTFPTAGGSLYLRLVAAADAPQIVGLGLHVDEGAAGKARLLLVEDDLGDPGAILASEEVVLHASTSDTRGTYGAEVLFAKPVPINGLVWIGYALPASSELTPVKYAASSAADDLRWLELSRAGSLMIGEKIHATEPYTDRPTTGPINAQEPTAPWIYAISF